MTNKLNDFRHGLRELRKHIETCTDPVPLYLCKFAVSVFQQVDLDALDDQSRNDVLDEFNKTIDLLLGELTHGE